MPNIVFFHNFAFRLLKTSIVLSHSTFDSQHRIKTILNNADFSAENQTKNILQKKYQNALERQKKVTKCLALSSLPWQTRTPGIHVEY